MTSKEKAQDLFGTFRIAQTIAGAPVGDFRDRIAKQCANMCVNETINEMLSLSQTVNNHSEQDKIFVKVEFLKQVIVEIEKL